LGKSAWGKILSVFIQPLTIFAFTRLKESFSLYQTSESQGIRPLTVYTSIIIHVTVKESRFTICSLGLSFHRYL